MWEPFIVVSGVGEVSRNGEICGVRAGDCFVQPADTQHRVRNASPDEDLVHYVIANEVEGGTAAKHRP